MSAALERDPADGVIELLEDADLLRPMAIRVAATLRLADHVANGVSTADELSARTGTHSGSLEKLMRFLITLGVFKGTADGYSLTERGELLAWDAPAPIARALDLEGMMGRGELAIANLLHTVRTGETAYSNLFGKSYWEDLNGDPLYLESLDPAGIKGSGFAWDAHLVTDSYDWSGIGHVVDVGGNAGSILISLLQKHSHLQGTVVDLPNFVKIAQRQIERAGLSDRCDAVVADMLTALPAGGDVYLLSAILSDWDDGDAVLILRQCAKVAGSTGRVLVAEVDMDLDLPDPEHKAAADLRMAAAVTVPSRSVDAIKELASRAGLRLTWEGPATRSRSILEFMN
ncbi:methyltransferase [Streptomyces sp. NPDC085927]|uniref:methyltransferase n=1 Tax=Streptomyces sp. NPDC085927 TaxID=3365738 RepID=UPI0037D20BCE